MKNTKKTILSLLFLIGISFCAIGGSTIYNGQMDKVAAANPQPNKELEDLNIVDKNQMFVNENTTILGNVVQFGPSIGAFVSYKSKNTYDNLHMAFETSLSPSLDSDWQRVILRAENIDNSLAGEVMGYFVSLYKDNFNLYKQVERGKYISLSNYYYPSELGSIASNIYTGEYISFDFKCYNVGDDVFMSMSMNGIECFALTDPGTGGMVYTNPGYAGFYMNSTNASWIMRTKITDSSYQPNVFLGDNTIYDPSSTATTNKEELRFMDSQQAFISEEKTLVETEFTLNPTAKATDGKIFAISTANSKQAYKSYNSLDGIVITFYNDKAVIKYLSNEIATINYSDIVNGQLKIKLITFFVAGETTVALRVKGTWYTYTTKLCTKNSGYVGLYSFANVVVDAPAHEERNFRILFIGNSITNHGPNESINYHIGTSSDSWAMATSAPEYDYVHRTVAAVRELPGYEDTEFLAINVANWEHDISLYDYANVYSAGAAFEPDLIVGRLGENVTSAPSAIHFEYYYNRLLNFFNSTGEADIVLTTKYWGSSNHTSDDSVTTGIINLARKNNYPLVRLDDLGTTYASINNATADYSYYHSLPGTAPGGLSWGAEFDGWTDGVKQHPGMVGHENIAARVSEAVIRVIKGEDVSISKLQPIDATLSVELNTSNIASGQPGAYDIKKASSFSATPITDYSGYTFATNYIPFKGYNITTDGVPYRFEMTLDEDFSAQLTYKAYTYDANNKFKEIKAVNNADSVRDGVLMIEGEVNKVLIICVEYNPSKIFSGNVLIDSKYSTILNYYNMDNTNYVIDVSASSKYITIGKDVLSTLIASGKDIEIRLKSGTFIIERKTFEVMASEFRPINFSIDKFTSNNDKQNATTAISKYKNFSGLETDGELVSSIYEVQIAYDSRNGDALYLAGGVKALIKVDIASEKLPNLGIVGAVLPAIGNDVKNVSIINDDTFYYNDGYLTIEPNDFNKDLILGQWNGTESLVLTGNYKTQYYVGESLDITGMTLAVMNKKGLYEPVTLTKEMISGFDSSKAGSCTITVTYRNMTTTANLTILEKPVPSSSSLPPSSSSKSGGGGCGGSISGGSIAGIAITSVILGISLFTALGVCIKRKEDK